VTTLPHIGSRYLGLLWCPSGTRRELWLELVVIALVLGVAEMALARIWTMDI